MKSRFAIFFFLPGVLLLSVLRAEGVPEVGMTTAQVRGLLGEPQGRMEMGASLWWTYERGKVQFRDGKLVEHNVVDEETFRVRRAEQEVARQQNREEGEALKRARLEDLRFLALPASERLRFWTQFRTNFPEVDVFTPLAEAQAEVQSQEQDRRDRQQLVNLEWRVREAEAQARRAEEQARDAMFFQRRTFQPQVVVWPTFVPYHHSTNTNTNSWNRGGLNISHQRNGLNVQFQTPRVNDPWMQPWGNSLMHVDSFRSGQSSGFTHGRSHGLRHESSSFSW